jgi:deazaflavin-dependent oxidoreductase (nitroreductase family)
VIVRALPHVDPRAPRGRARRAILRLLATRPSIALERSLPFRALAWRLAPRLLRATGGRLAALLPFPAAVVETRDARNGRPHRRAVVYFHDAGDVVLIPSKAGLAEDPFWHRNALAHPDVRLAAHPYRARPVTDPADLARLWSLADGFYPPAATYRALAARHDRTIPVLRLTPR